MGSRLPCWRRLGLAAAAAAASAAAVAQAIAPPREAITPAGLRIWCFAGGGDRFRLQVLVGSGARDELPEQEGVAHLLQHVLLTSTTAHGKAERLAELAALGATVTGTTTHEHSAFCVDAPAAAWRRAVEWLAEQVLQPAFAFGDVQAERDVVHREIVVHDPHAGEPGFAQYLYPHDDLGRTVAGDAGHLGSLAAETLRDFHGQHYRAGNMAVGFAGPVPVDDCVAAIRAAFAPLTPGGEPPRARAPAWTSRTTIVEGDTRRQAAWLVSGFHLPAADLQALAVQRVIAAYARQRFVDAVLATKVSFSPVVTLHDHREVHRLDFEAHVPDPRLLPEVLAKVDVVVAELGAPDAARFKAALAAQRTLLAAPTAEDLGKVMALCWLCRRGGAAPAALAAAVSGVTAGDLATYARQYLVAERRFTLADAPLGAAFEPWMALVLLLLLALLLDGARGLPACRRAAAAVASLLRRHSPRPPDPAAPSPGGRIRPGDADELIDDIQRYLDEERR